ncbi:PEP-CTERM sorting domain-containing protein [Luteolibacter sp. AS25]|uniref:PEP-CTERM sorting domain-containing protein n=1 Tax=Luteolibacter sp. AS25 TaxID=3135776 RepID=UPI00398AFB8A
MTVFEILPQGLRFVLYSLLAITQAHSATVFFEENFSSTNIVNSTRPYLGGWYSNQVSYNTWTAGNNVSIATNSTVVGSTPALVAAPTSGVRTAAIVFDSNTLTSAGVYTLTFDITSYVANTSSSTASGNASNAAIVNIYAGTNYDTSKTSASGLIVNTETGILEQLGNAKAELLDSQKFTSAVTSQQMTFTYSGTGAIVMFFGAETGGWPFPSASFDNISITSAAASASAAAATTVPEPSAMAFAAILFIGLLSRRRR